MSGGVRGRASGTAAAGARTLVAGIGNIFLSDDGFGVEVVRRLGARPLPAGVEVRDIGVRGVHLAYQLLDGYRTVILVDASARGRAPGTLYLIDGTGDPAAATGAPPAVDGHHMSPDAVLALLATLRETVGGEQPGRVLIVGCEPACLEEGIGLSPPVAAAVDKAVEAVRRLLDEEPRPAATPAAAPGAAGGTPTATPTATLTEPQTEPLAQPLTERNDGS